MHYHLIAIGGAVMHNLAIALHKAGHKVTGSDDEIYDPSRSRLQEQGLLPKSEGWDINRITNEIDQVILGMHARNDNPELHRALNLGIDVKSFPEFIYDVSKDKKRIVVGGSHGKTTTTSMIMHACKKCNVDIDYLVGAQLEGFTDMVKISDAPIIVVEGDEYPSSPLDRTAKFLHYRPHIAVITGIAWDHINIFPNYVNYKAQFRYFIESIMPDGKLIYYKEDSELSQMKDRADKSITLNEYTEIEHNENEKGVELLKSDGSKVPIDIFGSYNMSNLAAAQEVCASIGILPDEFKESMRDFKGAAKRQQVLGESEDKIVYLDFAHAPSKVKATTNSMVNRYGGENIIACLELHTFSSLSKQFLPHYKNVFDNIDHAMVFYSPHTIKMKQLEPIEPDDIRKAFNDRDLEIGHEASDIEYFINQSASNKKVLLLMSSGKFGGLDLEVVTDKFLNL